MNSDTIPTYEAKFHTSLSPEHTARLFEWQGDLYRAVHPEHQSFFSSLFQNRVIDRLVTQGLLIDGQPTDLKIDGYGMVIKHRRIPVVSYPFEWSAQALRDAALKFIELNLALADHDLCTSDAHSWNILLDGANPLFVDYGSLAPRHTVNGHALLDDFTRWFIYPLKLMQAGQHRLARSLLHDLTSPISDSEFDHLQIGLRRQPRQPADRRFFRRAVNKIKRLTHLSQTQSPKSAQLSAAQWRRLLEKKQNEIRAIRLNNAHTAWSHYYTDDYPAFDAPHTWDAKQRMVHQVLDRLRPPMVHDIAGNAGWFSQLAANMGSQVICSDIDENCLNQIHRAAHQAHQPITALHLDLRHPTPAMGWSNRTFPSASKRLRADCVLALALVHHMVFRAMADFPIILDGLAAMTRKDLVVEFVSRDDKFVRNWCTPQYDWYTLDAFAEQASRLFKNVTVVPSHPNGRYLVVCEKIATHNRNPLAQAA